MPSTEWLPTLRAPTAVAGLSRSHAVTLGAGEAAAGRELGAPGLKWSYTLTMSASAASPRHARARAAGRLLSSATRTMSSKVIHSASQRAISRVMARFRAGRVGAFGGQDPAGARRSSRVVGVPVVEQPRMAERQHHVHSMAERGPPPAGSAGGHREASRACQQARDQRGLRARRAHRIERRRKAAQARRGCLVAVLARRRVAPHHAPRRPRGNGNSRCPRWRPASPRSPPCRFAAPSRPCRTRWCSRLKDLTVSSSRCASAPVAGCMRSAVVSVRGGGDDQRALRSAHAVCRSAARSPAAPTRRWRPACPAPGSG